MTSSMAPEEEAGHPSLVVRVGIRAGASPRVATSLGCLAPGPSRLRPTASTGIPAVLRGGLGQPVRIARSAGVEIVPERK